MSPLPTTAADLPAIDDSAQRQISYLAFHDHLTGLPNRLAFRERLEAALVEGADAGQALGLLYVDLNDFKLVNDGLGHRAGDRLLCEVAERLRRAIRGEDLLARQGGDEFLIMLSAVGARRGEDLARVARDAAAECAERIAAQLAEPFTVDHAELLVDASVGFSLFPFDASDADTLLRRADAAMYQAKAAGAGSAAYRSTTTDPLEELSLAARLRGAIANGELELHYQPIFRVADHSAVGLEALVRWRDPERGLVAPGAFIPVAEKTGLIERLGEWVLEELCRQARAWADEGLTPNFGINVSPRQLRRPGFAGAFRARIASHGLDPSRFVVELTESAWSLESVRAGPVLKELRQSGLALAIDDFGAGYSSLSRLRELSVQVIKIDRSFMAGIPDNGRAVAVVGAILDLAKACECDVVAEGVETEAQLEFLAERGCRLVQGFHLARPLDAAAATKLLRKALVASRRTD